MGFGGRSPRILSTQDGDSIVGTPIYCVIFPVFPSLKSNIDHNTGDKMKQKQSIFFRDLGIYGWSEIEPIILSAIVADKSVLLIGDHGCNKTESCEVISKAILGQKSEFRHYEVPHLNFDDLLGYTDPKSLSKGELKFIPTPISIWGAKAALFDEINKVNPFVQGKLHEVIRTKKIMGLQTDLKICLSAINPPVKYQVAFMDIPLASRFCCVQVPSYSDFNDTIKGEILNKGKANGCSRLKAAMSQAKRQLVKIDHTDIDPVILKLIKDLKAAKVSFSGRQARDLKHMFAACKALNSVCEIEFDTDTLAAITVSLVPEANNICRTDVEPQQVYGIAHTTLQGFQFNDPLMVAGGLADISGMDIEGLDLLDWMASLREAVKGDSNVADLENAVVELNGKEMDDTVKGKILSSVGKIIVQKESSDRYLTEILF